MTSQNEFDLSINAISNSYVNAMNALDNKVKGNLRGRLIDKLNKLLKKINHGFFLKIKSTNKAIVSVTTAKIVFGFVSGYLRSEAEHSNTL